MIGRTVIRCPHCGMNFVGRRRLTRHLRGCGK